jgi:DNA-binding CsgD family transcriptional regulator
MILTEPTDIRIFDSNPSFTLTNEIIEFTKPLESVSLNYFTFDRHYTDGSRIVLTNSIDWIRTYWLEKLYEKAIFERDTSKFCNGYIFWSWLNREPVYSAAALYGIDHGITIVEKSDGHCDFFHFGSVNNSRVTNDHILKNIHHLYRFISLFRHRMRDAIAQAEKHRIRLPEPVEARPIIQETLDERIINSAFDKLSGRRNLERIYLSTGAYLTKRELDLIRLLTRGWMLSEVADQLRVSEDAINKYIRNIKEKLNCKTLCEVGFVIGKLAATHAYPFLIDQQEHHGTLARHT